MSLDTTPISTDSLLPAKLAFPKDEHELPLPMTLADYDSSADFKIGFKTPLSLPALTTQAMTIIAAWSEVYAILIEAACSRLRNDFVPITAILNNIDSDGAKSKAINECLKTTHGPEEVAYYNRVVSSRGFVYSKSIRNKFAHAMWGHIPGDDSVLLVLESKNYCTTKAWRQFWLRRYHERINEYQKEQFSGTPPLIRMPQLKKSAIWVFDRQTLEKNVELAQQVVVLVTAVNLALSLDPKAIEQARNLIDQMLPQEQSGQNKNQKVKRK